MLRKLLVVGFVASVMVSLAVAGEFPARITKVAGNKVTFFKFNFKEKTKGEEETLPTASDVKVVSGKINKEEKKLEAGEPLANGLQNERFQNIEEKGVGAVIVTDADNKQITEIRVFPAFKKKKNP